MRQLSFFLLCGLLLLVVRPSHGAEVAGFQVVVHPSNPLTEVKRSQLAQLFLKKSTQWPSGQPALPVDLGDGSPVRAAFSDNVLKRSVPAVRAYWQQRIFSGRDVPPAEKATEADVLGFVRANPGAVGYVASGVAPAGVKVLVVVD
jgi:ABC-type phosphate transport system substrate-binding protein